MGTRKRAVPQSLEYPYETDLTLKGEQARIKGERGVYTIHAHEFNPTTGKHWFVMWGGTKGQEMWRHRHPSDVKPVKRGASFG